MKKVTTLLYAVFMSLAMMAQVPQSFKYQTVARNNAGDILANQNITFRITILQGELPGTVVYTETHAATTNAFGVTNLEIGRGTPVTGSFATINWSTTPIFLKTEIDPAGGVEFVEMGTSELLSVPYALFAENTANNGIKSYSQTEIDLMIPYNGLTVHNSTTNCINYYYINNWYEACGTCTPQPTQAAAGLDQNFTNNTTAATLAANTPTQGTGLWTVQSGAGGSFDDATNPAATFTGQPCTSYTLAWTITNTCGASVDQASVSFFETPTVADAGNDTVVGGAATSMYLYANTPETGTGMWTIVSGTGGVIKNAASPTSLFSGTMGNSYTLKWEITTNCATSSDLINVAFANLQVGEPYQGGIIAYILQPGDPGYVAGETHGIIAAASNQSTGALWGCWGTTIPGADGTVLGTGKQNTLDIVAGCSTVLIAARLCNDLELNSYTDWYLPSKDELNKLYINRAAIGGFASAYYWSSSEYSSYDAWSQTFVNGFQYNNVKDYPFYVRAVRAF